MEIRQNVFMKTVRFCEISANGHDMVMYSVKAIISRERSYGPFDLDLDPNEGPYTFMQDNTPCYTARLIRGILKAVGIPILPLPGNSPNLTIEQ